MHILDVVQSSVKTAEFVFLTHSYLPLPHYLFWRIPFSNLISFSLSVSSLPPTPLSLPVLSSLLSVCDRSMLYPFGFPLQLYSPGN